MPSAAAKLQRSDGYYATKSMIFGAFVEAIDLSQLSRLDGESAREEIRDIAHEIIAIKSVAMSTAEQQDMIDDICNDVLGFGPRASSCTRQHRRHYGEWRNPDVH